MSTPDLPWKYMRELDIELWKTWKKSDLFKKSWRMMIDTEQIVSKLDDIEFHLFRSFQYQSSSFQRLPLKLLQGLTTETAHPKSMDQVPSYGSQCLHWRLSPHENLGRQKCQISYIPHTSLFEKNGVLGVLPDVIWFSMKDGSLKHMMTWWCEFWKDQHRYPNATISFLYLASFTSIHSLLVRL